MVLPIIVGQAIIHGLRIAGLRILPYIIRSKTAKSAAQYATKKVGQKSITDTGYVVITNDPTKFKLAQRIFGKNKVFRNDKIYDILINIKYNYSPVLKGKGSAIFLHLTNKKYKATKGCVAIQKKDFLKILPLINKNTKILIK